MNRVNRKTALTIIAIEILVILGTALWGFSKEKVNIQIPYEEILGTTIPDERDGWYVDSTFPLEESGLFDFSPDYELPMGTYDITVRYETDTSKNYCMVDATTKGFHSLKADKTPLQKEVHEITFTAYLLENVKDFKIRTFFTGEGYMIIRGFSITQTNAFLRILLFMELFLFLLVDAVYLLYTGKYYEKCSLKTKIELLLIVGIVFCSSYPLFIGGMFPGHDLEYHLLRIDGIKEGLLAGQFPVKIQPNFAFGFGYAASTYYGDLFLYIPAILRLIGFSVNTSYVAFMLLMNAATTVITLQCLKVFWKDSYIPILGTFLYVMSPYRLADIYIRASFGEAEALTFLPLIFCGMYVALMEKENERRIKNAWIPITLGLSGLIQSHFLSTLMCGILMIVACVIKIKAVFEKERFFTLFKAFCATILLNLWFLFPFVSTIGIFTQGREGASAQRIQMYGAYLGQLFNLFYQGAGALPINTVEKGIVGELPSGLGLAIGLGIVIFILACFDADSKKIKWKKELGIFFFGLVTLFLSTVYFPWDLLAVLFGKLNQVIVIYQFPIRFLGIANVFLVATCCFGLAYWEKQNQLLFRGMFCVVFTISLISGIFLLDNRINNTQLYVRYDIDEIGTTDRSIVDFLLKGTEITQLQADVVNTSGQVSFDGYRKAYTTVTMNCKNESQEQGYIEVPLLYYPHYKVQDSAGDKLQTIPGDNNVLRINLPANYQGSIRIACQEPVSWRIAEIISLICLGLFVVELRKSKKRQAIVIE